jgi:hypothetical protein
MRVPRFVGRMFAGEVGAVFMTDIRGVSNAKAKRDLGWQPKHVSWRQGSQRHDRRERLRRREGRGLDDLRPYGTGVGQSGKVPVPLASVQTMRPWIDGLIGELAAMKSATSASIRFLLVDLKATLG